MRIQHILLILFYINMLQTSVRVDDVVVSMLQVQSVETWFLLIKINSFWIGQQYFLIILDGLCLILRRILTFMSIRTIPVVFAFSRDFKKSRNWIPKIPFQIQKYHHFYNSKKTNPSNFEKNSKILHLILFWPQKQPIFLKKVSFSRTKTLKNGRRDPGISLRETGSS